MSDDYIHLEGIGWLPLHDVVFSPDGHDPMDDEVEVPDDHDGNDYFHVRVDDFEVLARPRLKGDDRRRPDVARTSFQSAVIRSFVDKPDNPFDRAYVRAHVPGDVGLAAAGTLKSILDAVVDAGVVENDRSAVVGASLLKYDRWDMPDVTTDIEVVPAISDEERRRRSVYSDEERDHRKFTSAVVEPVAYAARSGVPGAVRFQNPWVDNPDEYEAHLRQRWRRLIGENRVLIVPDDWAPLFLSARLSVYLPKRCTEDGDNALLYIVDMLEVARRDILGNDAGDRTLDELLVEVHFRRALDSGVWIWLSPIDRRPQFDFLDYMGDEPWSEPFDPNAL